MPGRLWVISAPSGAGKTSLVKALCERLPQVRMSISYTTRTRRPREVDGRDYRFVDRAGFDAKVAAGDFLEHAEVFGNCYGTARADVDALLETGHDVILEIDWQGARQARAAMAGCRSVFILPPSRAELERRLRGRGSDDDEVIARRLGQSVADMSHWAEFDHVIVNDDFASAVEQLVALIRPESAYPARRPEVQRLIDELVGGGA